MVKKRTTATIDPTLLADAKKLGLNLSAFLEIELIRFLNDNRYKFFIKCTKCGTRAAGETIIKKNGGHCPTCGELLIERFKEKYELEAK